MTDFVPLPTSSADSCATPDEPLVSVIIPAFNRADTIRRAIDSALSQDWPAIEVLVVDDGSTDGTPEIVRSYGQSRVRLIERKRNGGAAAARNSGIAAAQGEYIAFLDSDDEFLPGKVRQQLMALRRSDDSSQLSCTSHYLHLLDQGVVVRKRLGPMRDDFLRMYLGCDVSPGSTLMARRDVFDRVGPLDESLRRFEDWDWLLRYTAAGGRILIVDELLARVYNRRGRLSADLRRSVDCFAAKIKTQYPDVDRRLQRRSIAGMWVQLYITALAEGNILAAFRAAVDGLRTDPAVFVRGMLGHLNSLRLRGNGAHERKPSRPAIAMVIHGIKPGGAEKVLVLLANALAARGWAVSLVVYQNEDHRPFYPLSPDIDYIALGIRNRPSGRVGRLLYYLYLLGPFRRTVLRKGSGVVLSFMDEINVHCLVAMLGSGVPVVVAERNDPSMHRCGRAIDFLRRRLYPRAAAVVVQTENAAGYFPKSMQPKIAVLPNPLPLADIRSAMPAGQKRAQRIVAIGRLDPQKGFDILLRAFARIAEEAPGWRLTIYGEGPMRPELTALRDSLGLDGRASLPGLTDNVPEVLSGAAIFVLSSRYEGFPNALLEAMACGVPVVSFDCRSGPSEIIRDGADGVLVPPESEELLADAVLSLIRDPDRRARLGAAAARAVQRYDEDRVMDLWEALLRRAGDF